MKYLLFCFSSFAIASLYASEQPIVITYTEIASQSPELKNKLLGCITSSYDTHAVPQENTNTPTNRCEITGLTAGTSKQPQRLFLDTKYTKRLYASRLRNTECKAVVHFLLHDSENSLGSCTVGSNGENWALDTQSEWDGKSMYARGVSAQNLALLQQNILKILGVRAK